MLVGVFARQHVGYCSHDDWHAAGWRLAGFAGGYISLIKDEITEHPKKSISK